MEDAPRVAFHARHASLDAPAFGIQITTITPLLRHGLPEDLQHNVNTGSSSLRYHGESHPPYDPPPITLEPLASPRRWLRIPVVGSEW